MKFEPKINIQTSDSCKVYITDESNYIDETAGIIRARDAFKYSETMSIDMLRHNKLQESIHREITISEHNSKQQIELPVNVDGWFSIVHIILPSKKWFDRELEYGEGSALGIYDIVFYSDGKKIYKYTPGTDKTPIEVPIYCLTDLNLSSGKYPVYICEQDYVSICFLRKCYINLCQQIFNDRGFSSCWNKNTIDSELVYKRDLAWMAINVIKYLTECEQLSEVERIIETLQGCNGLCTPSNITSKTNGCGCSK